MLPLSIDLGSARPNAGRLGVDRQSIGSEYNAKGVTSQYFKSLMHLVARCIWGFFERSRALDKHCLKFCIEWTQALLHTTLY